MNRYLVANAVGALMMLVGIVGAARSLWTLLPAPYVLLLASLAFIAVGAGLSRVAPRQEGERP